MLQRAVFHVQSSVRKEVTGGNVLVAIFSEQESQAVYFLKQQNIARIDVVNYIAHGISKVLGRGRARKARRRRSKRKLGGEGQQQSALEAFATNLNEQARRRPHRPPGRSRRELERVIQVLCRRRKNNPLLVGESGVGKTAIAEGLAKRIVDGQVPEVVGDSTFMRWIWAPCWPEPSIAAISKSASRWCSAELKKDEGAILFIDEVHTIIGAGAASAGSWMPPTC